MQRGLSTIGLLPIAVIFSIYIKRGWLRMKVQPPTRWARGGQTQGLIKLYCMDSPTGFEVRQVKSTGSEVALETDLHLTHQLEMIISRCITVSCSKGWYHGDLLCGGLLLYTEFQQNTTSETLSHSHTHTPALPESWAVYGQGILIHWTGQAADRRYTQAYPHTHILHFFCQACKPRSDGFYSLTGYLEWNLYITRKLTTFTISCICHIFILLLKLVWERKYEIYIYIYKAAEKLP